MKEPSLILTMLFNANKDSYRVIAHNQVPEEAIRFREKWNPRIRPGVSLITIEQRRAHTMNDAQSCRACRRTVRRSTGLPSLPKFYWRKL